MTEKTVVIPNTQQIVIEQKFVVGLDLGQQNDYTALVILDRKQQNITEQVGHTEDDLVIEDIEVNYRYLDAVYHCRHIERLQLGTPYPVVVDHVKALVDRPEIENRYMLVVDQTGVGRPVFDLILKSGLTALGVTITGGDTVTFVSRSEARVAKRLLVSTLQAVIQSKRLAFASGMDHVDTLQKELLDFRVKVNDHANDLYAAREGTHDDLVLSLAMALWFGEKCGNPKKKSRSFQG